MVERLVLLEGFVFFSFPAVSVYVCVCADAGWLVGRD